jgi:hypothetical protein
MIDVQDESLSDEHNESGNCSSSIQTAEEEIDDGRQEYGCCRAGRKSFPSVKFHGLGLIEK